MTTKLVNGQRIDITGTGEEVDLLNQWADMEPGSGPGWLAEQQAIIDRAKQRAKELQDDLDSTHRLLRAILKLMVQEVNTLRAQHGLPARTGAQVRAAIEGMIDGE